MLTRPIVPLIAAVASYLITGDWLAVVCTLVLWAIWVLLRPREGPPILAIAMTLQWIQVSAGVYYIPTTGRELEALNAPGWREMVLIGLVSVLLIAIGIAIGIRLISARDDPSVERPEHAFTFKVLVATYAVAIALSALGQELAWSMPTLTQVIIALTYIRLGLLYLVFRRLVSPTFNWPLMLLLLSFEVVLGFTGYFARFREPLVLAAVASLEVFDSRKAAHWLAVAGLLSAMAVTSLFWMSVRTGYREAFWQDDNFAESRSVRLDRLRQLSSGFASESAEDVQSDVDRLVNRMWAIYYPALALDRVPTVLPHTDGALMHDVIVHILSPRVFYTGKPGLMSDSELVRKYSGVLVAGEESNTDIAFGYAAESYVDYGIPIMFVPMLIFGVFMGVAYAGFLRFIRHRDLAVGLVTVIGWLSLYLFERSWAKTVGLAGTLMIYVGGFTLIVDRIWLEHHRSLGGPEPAWDPGVSDAESVGRA